MQRYIARSPDPVLGIPAVRWANGRGTFRLSYGQEEIREWWVWLGPQVEGFYA